MKNRRHTMAARRCGRRRWGALAGLGGVAIATLIASCSNSDKPPTNACGGSLELGVSNIVGSSLPMKTLALTFDDGPGLRTDELSTYLKEQGIQAGFFVNGRMFNPDGSGARMLTKLVADGHVIGNHTQTHRSLTGRSTGTERLDAVTAESELDQTDVIIKPFVPNDRYLFRAPFGDYDEQSFEALENSPMKKYVGPINWDIGDHMGPNQAVDWDCWQQGSDGKILTVQECGDLYAQEIDAVGKGIVLLHDPYFIGDDPAKGGTVDMVKYLVPMLKAKGYAFARIDDVPDISALLPPLTPAVPDAGDDAGTTPSTGVPDASTGSSSSSGGNPDPCPPSPQSQKHVIGGESGNLRASSARHAPR